MIKIDSDIFVFKSIIPKSIIDELLLVRDNIGGIDRIDVDKIDMSLFYKINDFWFNNIEYQLLDDYLKIYDIENGIGLNASHETIKNIKDFVKTKWRDMFLLHYYRDNTIFSEKNVHWDFSGLTFVGLLNNNFKGGELCFPRQDISYNLELGDIIIFPGGLTHPHFIKPVTDGRRDVLVGQSLTLIQNHKIDYE
jgi:hypothetical protein